ncbi:MAG: serine/threonine-protein kinase [Acidobacteriota bacterium]
MRLHFKIGRYEIKSKLGKGGMGDVYHGFDEVLERDVALKCIRPENRLDKESKERFLIEAKVLSQLGHPNICQIYDYIEGDEADYLVLELISGKSLSEEIKENKLSKKQKLSILRSIAEVLSLAHEKGIIHRDLKPENIKVTKDGGIKVLDFGLARQINFESTKKKTDVDNIEKPKNQKLSDQETFIFDSGSRGAVSKGLTTAGVIMGTLGYMSPEQARGEEVTPSSDMYSFGIIVEELFSGKTSYNLEESIETLLAKNQKGERIKAEIEDKDISQLIDELTRLEPNARLTARETVKRIDEIIEKPARIRKRNIIAATMALLFILAVLATIFAIKSAVAEKKAKKEAETARQVSDFLVNLFEVSDPNEARGEKITAKEVLYRGVQKIGEELKEQPDIQSRLMSTMGAVYTKLGLYKDAKQLQKDSLEINKKIYGEKSREVAENYAELAQIFLKEGNFKEAEEYISKSIQIYEERKEKDSEIMAQYLNNLGEALAGQYKLDEALKLYEKSLSMREKKSGANDVTTATVINNMALIYSKQSNYIEAEKYYRAAYEIWKKNYGENHPDVASALNNIAQILKKQNKLEEAEEYYLKSLEIKEKIFEKDHPSIGNAMNNLGALYYSLKDYDKAYEYWSKASEIFQKAYEKDNPILAISYNNVAMALKAKKDYDQALEYYSKALAIFEKSYGKESVEVAKISNNMGHLYLATKKFQEAEQSYKKAIRISEKILGRNHSTTVHFKLQLGEFYYQIKDYKQDEYIMKSVWDELQRSPTAKDSDKILVLNCIVNYYESLNKNKDAEIYRAILENINKQEKTEQVKEAN